MGSTLKRILASYGKNSFKSRSHFVRAVLLREPNRLSQKFFPLGKNCRKASECFSIKLIMIE